MRKWILIAAVGLALALSYTLALAAGGKNQGEIGIGE